MSDKIPISDLLIGVENPKYTTKNMRLKNGEFGVYIDHLELEMKNTELRNKIIETIPKEYLPDTDNLLSSLFR